MTGVAIYFHNIPGAMMRVLNCFTRRGLLLEAVWCAPVGEHHRATVLVEAPPITIDQTVRELNSTVGVDRVEVLEAPKAEQWAGGRAPEVVGGDNGSTVIKVPGPAEEYRFLLDWLGAARS
ncbi:MAG TPA: hypothetical protein VGQ73_03740, partial [Gemmatimonadales bacterium]|nr:hypothetical protein [Gemmatimonadales bacterium]